MPFDSLAAWKLLTGAWKIVERIKDADLREELRTELDRLNQHFTGGLESLQNEARDLRERMERAEKERDDLREENRKLKDAAIDRADVSLFTRDKNCYRKDGLPYCVTCLEDKKKARSLVQPDRYDSRGECPTCKTAYSGVFEFEKMPFPSIGLDESRLRTRFPGF